MKIKSSSIAIAVGALLMAGCSRQAGEVRSAGGVPPLSPTIAETAAQQGNKIVGEAFRLLSSNLQNAIQEGGISNALPYCSVAALPLTRTVAEEAGVTVRRISHRPRNPQGRADDFETTILRAFEESLKSTNAPAPLVTNVTPGAVTYFAPIVLNQQLCLKCHGEPDKDILPEHAALINKLYPGDEAKGFKVGQLRGAWRVDFPLATLENPR